MATYFTELLIQVALYAALAMSLWLLAARAGLVSVCHAAFFGIGAYASAIIRDSVGVGLAAGVAVAACLALIVARFANALPVEYFVLVSFAIQTVISGVYLNWLGLTRGGMGIPGVPPIVAMSRSVVASLTGASCVLVIGLVAFIARTPYGRLLAAIRDDERFAASLAKNIPRQKTVVTVLAATIAAAIGSLYAHWVGYVSPETFDVNRSILLLSMVIVGGAERVFGAALGAALLVLIPEVARLVVGGPIAANLQGIFYGIVLVAAVVTRPRGIWSRGRVS